MAQHPSHHSANITAQNIYLSPPHPESRADLVGRENCCSLRTPHKELIMQAGTNDEADAWVFSLSLCCSGKAVAGDDAPVVL